MLNRSMFHILLRIEMHRKRNNNVTLRESLVVKNTVHIKGKGRNICCDSFFYIFSVGSKTTKAKLFLIGIIKKN